MNALLFASLAANLVALIAVMCLLASREAFRELASERWHEIKDIKQERNAALDRVHELEAMEARRMAPLIAANAKRKADAAKAH
jgi:hypothetical protein